MPEPGNRIKKQTGDYHKNHSADSKDENRVVGDRPCRRTISFENVGHSGRAIGKDWSCGHAQRKEYEPGFSNQPAIIRNEKFHRAFLGAPFLLRCDYPWWSEESVRTGRHQKYTPIVIECRRVRFQTLA